MVYKKTLKQFTMKEISGGILHMWEGDYFIYLFFFYLFFLFDRQ